MGDEGFARVVHREGARGTQMTMAGRILVMAPRRGASSRPGHSQAGEAADERITMAARKAPAAKTVTNDRNKALEVALSQIDKQFGKGSVMRLGDDNRPPVQVIPTGSLALDVALGIGGLPRGRVIEVYGPESSGKTTVALHAVANAQKAGGNAAFIDAEHALDPVYARALGVDTDSLLVSQPDTGEQALEIADMLIRSGGIDIIVIDSVAALVPKAEIEGEMGDSHVGLQARLMSQALRKITGALSATGTTAIFINQLREKIGVFFGSPETTTGGKALKFYASVRIDVRRIETLKEAGSPVGNRTRAKVVKNKMAPPFKQAEFDIVYGKGISREGSIIDMGVEAGIVRKSGSWFTYGDDQLGQGKENVRQFLVDNPELANEIENKILVALGITDAPEADKGASDAPEVDPDEDAGF
ncbi:RecA protein [Actinomyces sp. oral taxon 172 str. F0311]|nr:RecA protein [Actinomyces sp. oral taxon 172 str. F0311]